MDRVGQTRHGGGESTSWIDNDAARRQDVARVGERKIASIDGRGAGVGICRLEDDTADAVSDDRSRTTDDRGIGKVHVGGALKDEGAIINGVASGSGPPSGTGVQYQDAAGVDGGHTGVGADSRKSDRAGARHRETTRALDDRADGLNTRARSCNGKPAVGDRIRHTRGLDAD